ncbi:dynamin family protein [Sodiomyces alkalinus F11]|uniref:Dynamin family protein n=1 Tax=Sodiomyces alkalinus (strain CBS 110278 / VKM F-3762 / F11) TaxID=1314773 RepID=A0A3N2QAK1_SODAK|nr:dynamin family protein [Sodiomyces alkalinus F11]ROT43756.1 dynamin family protein [Sodiomyces alkalinus F11]
MASSASPLPPPSLPVKQEPKTASDPSHRSHSDIQAYPSPVPPPPSAISPSATRTHAPRSDRSDTYSLPPARHWQPASVNDSFIRSDAPPPPTYKAPPSAPTAPSAPSAPGTRDGSEPVFLQMRNRAMAFENPAHQSQGDSFFDGSFRDIGAKLKACNDTLGELQQIGVSHIVSLPKLVLVGDQSAGKSSLMSGLAGLNLPRSEGVCTRCPIHIRVSRHHEWSCRVSLQLDYAFKPPMDRSIERSDVTPETPFPPWVRQPREVKEFMTIYAHNQSEIENVLRWAQVAILNHDQNSDHYIPGRGTIARTHDLAREAEETKAKFSPNTVALEIKGPDLPDLSFYDLPGIFRNSAREEDEYLVQVVENLAREYIAHQDALIIWAVPMNADPETSSTLSIIRELKAQARTIGVMTKADLLPNDGHQSHHQWLSILRGERHQIGHEYFITSRMSDKGLEDQARWEGALFSENGHEKWPAVFSEFRDRCGVERLKTALSEKLGKEFAKNLPSIKKKVLSELNKYEKELDRLPGLPQNVQLEVQKGLREFTSVVKDKLKGKEFSSHYGKLAEAFRDCLLHTKPKFVLRDPTDTPVFEISDDEDEASTPTGPPRKRSAPGTNGFQAPKRGRANNGSAFNGGGPSAHGSFSRSQSYGVKVEEGNASDVTTPQTPVRRRGPPSAPAPFEAYSKHGSRFRTIRQIRQDIQAKTKAGMPNLVPDEVYEDLCKQAVRHWNGPLQTLIETTRQLLNDIINQALNQAFVNLKKRLIFKESKRYMQSFLQDSASVTEQFLHEFYRMETFQLFTINRDSFSHYEKEEGRLLTRYRHVVRWDSFIGAKRDGGGSEHGENPPPGANFQDWDRMTPEQRASEEKRHAAELVKMGPDPFDKEVRVASYVRGYYRLAALRFADTVPLYITSRMFPDIVNQLDYHLDQKLGLLDEGAHAAYLRLMDEDLATAEKRTRCKVTVRKLNQALDSIRGLEAEAADVEAADVETATLAGDGMPPRAYPPAPYAQMIPESAASDCI